MSLGDKIMAAFIWGALALIVIGLGVVGMVCWFGDRLYAGVRSYSVPFIYLLVLVGIGVALFAIALMQ